MKQRIDESRSNDSQLRDCSVSRYCRRAPPRQVERVETVFVDIKIVDLVICCLLNVS